MGKARMDEAKLGKAALSGNAQWVGELLAAGEPVDEPQQIFGMNLTALGWAACNGHHEAAAALLAAGADPRAGVDTSALAMAATSGHVECLKAMAGAAGLSAAEFFNLAQRAFDSEQMETGDWARSQAESLELDAGVALASSRKPMSL